MRDHLSKATQFFVIMIVIFSTMTLLAQPKEKMTVEWIYSDTGQGVDDVPNFFWRADNKAILLDSRQPEDSRTFELLDPKSGKRQPLVDAQKALASLADARGDDSTKTLAWPASFHSSGKHALYIMKGDIFLLDIAASSFQRLMETAAVEKSARFSPDGKMLAFIRENDIYVYDIAAGTEQRLTDTGSETLLNGTVSWVYWEEIFGRQDLGYWWSNDSRSIAYLRTDESAVDLMHYLHFKPATPKVITQRYPKAGSENPDVHLGIINLGSSETTWLQLGDHDYEYICRVNWMPDNKRLSVQTMNRAQSELDLFWVDRESGLASHVMQENDYNGWVNINDDLHFIKNSKQYLWQSERDGYAHLYRFDADGKLKNQVTKGDWALRTSMSGPFWKRQSITSVDEKKGWIYFTSMKESSIERHLYRVKFDGSGMEKISEEKGTHRISFSPNGEYYFDTYSNIKTLPSFSVHRKDGKRLNTIAAPRPELLADYDLQYPELMTIPATDGFPMPAEILKPRDFDPNKKYPVVYYIYAGPSAPTVFDAWRGNSIYFDNMLLDRGYLVVRFDHRSATAISKKLENLLNGMMSGPRELKDIIAGVKWLKSQPYIDGDRFGIWGWSGGGSFTLNAMTNSQEFKAGIAGAAVTDWHYYDTRWAEFGMKRPQDNPEGYEKTSFVKTAKNLHGRLMLIHGTYDDNVHPQNSWHFADELIKHNIMFDMMFYPMRKHSFSDRPARIHMYNTMLEFWQQWL